MDLILKLFNYFELAEDAEFLAPAEDEGSFP